MLAIKEDEKVMGSTNMYVNLEAALFEDNFQRKLVVMELGEFREDTYR